MEKQKVELGLSLERFITSWRGAKTFDRSERLLHRDVTLMCIHKYLISLMYRAQKKNVERWEILSCYISTSATLSTLPTMLFCCTVFNLSFHLYSSKQNDTVALQSHSLFAFKKVRIKGQKLTLKHNLRAHNFYIKCHCY